MKTIFCVLFLALGFSMNGCSRESQAPAQSEVSANSQTPTPQSAKPLASPTEEAATDDSDIPSDMEEKDNAETSFGKLIVAAKENDYHHKLYFNGKVISEYEGPIRLYEVFKAEDRDYVVGADDTGGIACPLTPFIIEIHNREKTETFQEFGTCRGDFDPKFVSGAVVLEIPPYFPHPDLISEKELKKSAKKMDVYTWKKGKLQKVEVRPIR